MPSANEVIRPTQRLAVACTLLFYILSSSAMKELQAELHFEGAEQIPESAGRGPSWKLLPTQTTDTTQQVVFVQSTVEKNEKDKDQ